MTAYAAFFAAILIAIAVVFAIDFTFERHLGGPERLVLLAAAVGGIVWAFYKFTKPHLGVREDLVQTALLVEKRHAIPSDLVAALQFESAAAAQWGSQRLQSAVIDHVANVYSTVNVFAGFDRSLLQRRGALLAVALGVAVIAGMLFPEYLSVFANRMLLGSQHYPTRTRIAQLVINDRLVLENGQAAAKPIDINAPQGAPLLFVAKCEGSLPAQGEVRLQAGGGHSALELKAFDLAARLERLESAAKLIADAQADAAADISGPWHEKVITLIRFDAPTAAEKLPDRAGQDLQPAADELAQAIAAWPGQAEQTALLAGELPRLVDNVNYQLFAGDAWTDAAKISLIPLPVVQPQLTAEPPPYARRANSAEPQTGRQLSALEGSKLAFAVESVNHKQLSAVWLTVKTKAGAQRLDLQAADAAGLKWTLPTEGTPFAALREELAYELQVTDVDQLHLESPIRGQIRLRPDRSPTVSAEMVHKVVLPTAEPVIDYRAADDFGIAGLRVKVEVERGEDLTAAGELRSSEDLTPGVKREAETAAVAVLPAGQTATGDKLPLAGHYPLKLAGLKLPRGPLQKGDRLKLVLEATDDRGALPGVSAAGEPLILEISDESGVLSAISEADTKSEERLTDIIKRQLGIGESK